MARSWSLPGKWKTRCVKPSARYGSISSTHSSGSSVTMNRLYASSAAPAARRSISRGSSTPALSSAGSASAAHRHVIVRPRLLAELDGFAEPVQPFAGRRPLVPGDGRLVHRLAAADAQEHPPGEEDPERREGLGHDRGVVPERRRDDARAELRARRAGTHRPEPRERERGVPVGVLPGVEVIADDDAVEPVLLGHDAVVEDLLRTELFGRCFPAEREHDLTLSARLSARCPTSRSSPSTVFPRSSRMMTLPRCSSV